MRLIVYPDPSPFNWKLNQAGTWTALFCLCLAARHLTGWPFVAWRRFSVRLEWFAPHGMHPWGFQSTAATISWACAIWWFDTISKRLVAHVQSTCLQTDQSWEPSWDFDTSSPSVAPESSSIWPNLLALNPTFAHAQTTHPNNIMYLPLEDEWKHWLDVAILTLGFWELGFLIYIGFKFLGFLGFRVLVLWGFRVLGGFRFWKSNVRFAANLSS